MLGELGKEMGLETIDVRDLAPEEMRLLELGM